MEKIADDGQEQFEDKSRQLILLVAAVMFLLVVALAAALTWMSYLRRSEMGPEMMNIEQAPQTTSSLSPTPTVSQTAVPTLSAGDTVQDIEKDINSLKVDSASSDLDDLSSQANSL